MTELWTLTERSGILHKACPGWAKLPCAVWWSTNQEELWVGKVEGLEITDTTDALQTVIHCLYQNLNFVLVTPWQSQSLFRHVVHDHLPTDRCNSGYETLPQIPFHMIFRCITHASQSQDCSFTSRERCFSS